MRELQGRLRDQVDQREVEPNSPMGKAINYMLKQWEPLTLFLRVPGGSLGQQYCGKGPKGGNPPFRASPGIQVYRL